MIPVRNIIFSFLMFFMFSCGEDIPAGLLSSKEMVPVLKDMHIGYAGIDVTVADEPDRKLRYAEINTLILDKHHLDKEVFFNSYQYYQDHPHLMDSIYTRVIEDLNLEMLPLQEKLSRPRGKVPQAE